LGRLTISVVSVAAGRPVAVLTSGVCWFAACTHFLKVLPRDLSTFLGNTSRLLLAHFFFCEFVGALFCFRADELISSEINHFIFRRFSLTWWLNVLNHIYFCCFLFTLSYRASMLNSGGLFSYFLEGFVFLPLSVFCLLGWHSYRTQREVSCIPGVSPLRFFEVTVALQR
jgi:hypothetical protein